MTRTLRRSTRVSYPEPQAGFWPAGTRKPSPSTTPENAEMFGRLDADLFLANQLFRAGLPLGECQPAGASGPKARQEHVRRAILAQGWASRMISGQERHAAPETFGEAFQRLYGEALEITGANAP